MSNKTSTDKPTFGMCLCLLSLLIASCSPDLDELQWTGTNEVKLAILCESREVRRGNSWWVKAHVSWAPTIEPVWDKSSFTMHGQLVHEAAPKNQSLADGWKLRVFKVSLTGEPGNNGVAGGPYTFSYRVHGDSTLRTEHSEHCGAMVK